MIVKRIYRGRKDFRPREGFKVYGNFDKLVWEFQPTESMIFDYKDGDILDKDWEDWKKGGGVSFVGRGWNLLNLFINNRENLQWAWRWNVELLHFDFGFYRNTAKEPQYDSNQSSFLQLNPGEGGKCIIKRVSTFQFQINLYDSTGISKLERIITVPFKPIAFKILGLWYGGKDNSKGKWGGRAPKDMLFYWLFKRIK